MIRSIQESDPNKVEVLERHGLTVGVPNDAGMNELVQKASQSKLPLWC